MAERSNRNRNTNNTSNDRMMDDEPILGNDMSSEMDDDMQSDFAGTRRGATVDPIDRVAQLYHFLRSPQVDTTIRRFVASRKTRQMIAAGMSILEIVVVLLPLVKKLGGRVNDFATLVKAQPRQRSTGSSSTGRSRTAGSRSLPAHGSSSVN